MASKSEKTIAKAIANAKQLHDIVELFPGYIPDNSDESLPNLMLLIDSATDANKKAATALSNYRKSTATRRQLFFADADSLEKHYADINRAVLRQYKQGSSEVVQVAAIIAQMRNSKRPQKDPLQPDKAHNSRSKRSFDSLASGFINLVEVLNSFSTPFAPLNPRVSVATLTALGDQLMAATQEVTVATSKHATLLNQRNNALEKLKAVAQSIKSAIGGQYGFDSDEFKQVKGIKL